MKVKFVHTEADVANEFYYQAKLRGWECDMEVRFYSRHHRSGFMRVDSVVRVEGKRICVVEFKREGRKAPAPTSRQGQAYAELKLPVIFCLGRKGVRDSIDKVEDLIHTVLAA